MATLAELPEGIFTLLDTDLYKLTMQCAILKYLPNIRVCGLPVFHHHYLTYQKTSPTHLPTVHHICA